MPYVWINPVTNSMYEPEVLDEFLRHHGYKRFYTSVDWLAIVKEKYRLVVSASEHVVMDMRCPKVKELLVEMDMTTNVTVPDIKPILIHCGQEACGKEELQGEEKIIITPCQALADMGNALGLENTWFVPWNKFIEFIGSELEVRILKKSPIPPGFFDELGLKTVSITGEDEIRNYFKQDMSEEVQLVEILYCKDGCHNGDGIKGCRE